MICVKVPSIVESVSDISGRLGKGRYPWRNKCTYRALNGRLMLFFTGAFESFQSNGGSRYP